jgi:hypothetical protein
MYIVFLGGTAGLQNSTLFAQSRLASEATAILSPQPTAETVFTLKAGSKQVHLTFSLTPAPSSDHMALRGRLWSQRLT